MKSDKYVKLKSETIRGRKVDFYEWQILNNKGNYVKEMVVANVEGIQPLGSRKFISGADTKETLIKRLPVIIDSALDRQKRMISEQESEKYKFKNMTLFYYNIIRDNPRRNASGSWVTAVVYKQTNNGMQNLGEVKWQSASTPGEEAEILRFLKKEGEVPQQLFPNNYYNWSLAEKYNMKISRL